MESDRERFVRHLLGGWHSYHILFQWQRRIRIEDDRTREGTVRIPPHELQTVKLRTYFYYSISIGVFVGAPKESKFSLRCQMVRYTNATWEAARSKSLARNRICLISHMNRLHCSGYRHINLQSYFWSIQPTHGQVFRFRFVLNAQFIELLFYRIFHCQHKWWATDIFKAR